MNMLTTGNIIRQARKGTGLSRLQLATRVGVDPQTVGRWERDERNISAAHALRVAEVLNIDVRELGYEVPGMMGDDPPRWATAMKGELLGELLRLNDILLEEIKRLRSEVHALKG